MKNAECVKCPYYGVIYDNKNEGTVWGCTRNSCVCEVSTSFGNMDLDVYLDLKANSFGFETYSDMIENRMKFWF